MTQILLSYMAGLVVLLNPSVLPVLPIILGSALGESRYGPWRACMACSASTTNSGFARSA